MRFRETNHLRKIANESGKLMRGSRRNLVAACPHRMITDKRICCACGELLAPHSGEKEGRE
jgi:hypothetical protein